MQLLFATCVVVVPALKLAYYVAIILGAPLHREQRVDQILDLGTDVLITASACFGIFLSMRGHFRLSVLQFLGVLLVSFTIGDMSPGMNHPAGDPTPYIVLALAGQILGRRALWMTYLALLVCMTLGALGTASAPHAPSLLTVATVQVERAIISLVIAVIVDQTMAPLRAALTESQSRGRELEKLNANLAQEIVMREKAQDHLIHVQKLEAVGRIATGVAHDFDNVLNVMIGYAAHRDRLADRGMPAVLDAMEDIELQARRALSISRKLLNFGRKDVIRSETFDAAMALHELQPMLRQFFGASTRLRLEGPSVGLHIRMDRGQFELMLLNLAANAADAMPQGGEFMIRLGADVGEKMLTLAVQDTGHGMSEEVRQRIFEPFYTTKPWGYGTGLGLSAVFDILSDAAGSVTVDSKLGEGATFNVRLPLTVPDHTEPARPRSGIRVSRDSVAL
ncbi:sensor histidine kinase [Dyella solisilvae]|nr:ATP-binding protein [Dyella solisilvae]